ncbi:Transcriptional regulator, GntR family domain / Aspartate aminotransferase [hydrothermal vent metagenome]|uniref:Transcriptional regulator, GntR family domain / Aspartate aminotransferase n=1 Tax=hydrothermal vent metagenome TaxID=652676 RepID=A0A3B0RCK2_9ZZZZ
MKNTTFKDAAVLDIVLDRQARLPLFEQLVQALREVILAGRLEPGSKLPSTRKFANELSVSRVTVVTAYDQLTAEGYIESRHGAGAFVAAGLPDEAPQVSKPFLLETKDPQAPRPLQPFQPTSPDMTLFPHKQWAKLFQRVWTNPDQNLLANADPLGWWPLRVQIAEHLRVWRGINCQPAQVVITSGASEALQTIIESMLEPGQSVAIEEPGYRLFSRLLNRLHLRVEGVPVDEHGMRVDLLAALQHQPVCAVTTPSRQYPLGITMPLARRLQLLEWTTQAGRFVIEDDYDSEYRYVGQPLPALMSLAREGSVIYLGSFSKVFSKSLRLGYMVIPLARLQTVRQVMKDNGPNASGFAQPVLAQFMASGAYASHIRSMRRIYSARQKVFVEAAQKHLQDLIEFEPAGGGMHLVGEIGKKLCGKMSDTEICQRADEVGVILRPLSESYNGKPARQGLIAGYAGFDENQLNWAIKRLARALTKQT